MDNLTFELLKMRHARAVATVYQYAACANRESASDGWLCDWAGAMRDANAEAVACEHEIACAIEGVTPEEVAEDAMEYRLAAQPSS